jgi:hypothetical protein
MAQWAGAALMFQRGDIAKAKRTLSHTIAHGDLSSGSALGRSFPKLVALIHQVMNGLETEPRAKSRSAKSASSKEIVNPTILTSDTGQLSWDSKAGLFRINSPRTQGALGLIGKKEIRHSDLVVKARTEFCSIMVTSLDDKDLRESSRILVITAGRNRNSGSNYSENRHRLVKIGQAPVEYETVRGKVVLRVVDNSNYALRTLNLDGKTIGSSEVAPVNGRITLELGSDTRASYYVLERK